MSSSLHFSRLRHAAHLFSSTPVYFNQHLSCSTVFTRRAILSASRSQHTSQHHVARSPSPLPETTPVVTPEKTRLSNDVASPQVAARPPPLPKVEKPRPRIRSTKAALTITSTAVSRLHALLSGPTPQLIRIGVRNKGCAGLSYHLEYVDKPEKFDEVVEQDGVRVLIDSKALFSIIGSEMDWREDTLSAKFSFKNPNIKDACGCGESFTVES